jgi:hypothetical protein
MYPTLLKSITTIEKMSRANYFYITAFPQYSGFRVEQDPVVTVYIATSEAPPTSSSPHDAGGFIVLVMVIVAAILVAAALLLRRKKTPSQ